jgi:hypothetical protein
VTQPELMIIAFLLPALIYFHRYWEADELQKMMQTGIFRRNAFGIGACLVFFYVRDAGRRAPSRLRSDGWLQPLGAVEPCLEGPRPVSTSTMASGVLIKTTCIGSHHRLSRKNQKANQRRPASYRVLDHEWTP